MSKIEKLCENRKLRVDIMLKLIFFAFYQHCGNQ